MLAGPMFISASSHIALSRAATGAWPTPRVTKEALWVPALWRAMIGALAGIAAPARSGRIEPPIPRAVPTTNGVPLGAEPRSGWMIGPRRARLDRSGNSTGILTRERGGTGVARPPLWGSWKVKIQWLSLIV